MYRSPSPRSSFDHGIVQWYILQYQGRGQGATRGAAGRGVITQGERRRSGRSGLFPLPPPPLFFAVAAPLHVAPATGVIPGGIEEESTATATCFQVLEVGSLEE